mgnify:CR=1 FL=1
MPAIAQNFLGDAQSSFEARCNVADVTKFPSIQDLEGWNAIVKFARRQMPGLP